MAIPLFLEWIGEKNPLPHPNAFADSSENKKKQTIDNKYNILRIDCSIFISLLTINSILFNNECINGMMLGFLRFYLFFFVLFFHFPHSDENLGLLLCVVILRFFLGFLSFVINPISNFFRSTIEAAAEYY